MKNNRETTYRLVLLALLTAIVILLQVLGTYIRFGTYSVSLVLVPIVVGAALLKSPLAGAWLGFVFGVVVLFSPDAAWFMSINPPWSVAWTFVIILGRGILAGFAAGWAYKLLANKTKTGGAVAASMAAPIVNTGLFILGLFAFFLPTIQGIADYAGATSVVAHVFLGMVGLNFVFELALNLVLCPVIVRVVQYGEKKTFAG